MRKKSAAMSLGSEALLSQLLVQTHFLHDMNLCLEFSAVILCNMKFQITLSVYPAALIPT